MARGTSLSDAVDQLRHELKETVNAATGQNTRENRKYTLRRVQEALYEEFDWPFLRVTHYAEIAAGQRFYNLPPNMTFERVERVSCLYNGEWVPLAYGITEEQYNIYDPNQDFRTDPVARWAPYNEDAAEQAQIEIWPVPSFNGTLFNNQAHGVATYTEGDLVNGNGVIRFTGIRNLNPLTDDADKLDLDDQLVVLNAAWETTKDEGLADKLLLRLNRRREAFMGNNQKTGIFPMNTGRRSQRRGRRTVVRTTVSN